MQPETRKCKKCSNEKLPSEFHSDGRGGKRNSCKACDSEKRKAAYRGSKDKFVARNKAQYAKNIERRRADAAIYYRDNKEAVLEQKRVYRQRFGDELNAKSRRWRLSLKCEMIEAYGGKCSCCGEKELAFLTLEHTNGDGAEHRRQLKHPNKVYTDLKRRGWPKDGYDVLCFNCNCSTAGGKICPHKLNKQVG